MAIDKRDVTLVNGAMKEQPPVVTEFRTSFVHADVTAEKVGKLKEQDTASGEITWHEVRFDRTAGQFASIRWKREMANRPGYTEKSDGHDPNPSGSFDAIEASAQPTASETNTLCKITVSVEVVVSNDFSYTMPVSNGIVYIEIKDTNDNLWVKATLDPIV